jgi:hypothetical protein
VQGWLAAYEDEVGGLFLMHQGLQPLFYGLDRQGLFAVLLRVYVAMSAFQVAASQYVKEYVSGVFLKSDGLCHISKSYNFVSRRLCFRNRSRGGVFLGTAWRVGDIGVERSMPPRERLLASLLSLRHQIGKNGGQACLLNPFPLSYTLQDRQLRFLKQVQFHCTHFEL